MKKAELFINTVRHLKPKQILFRLFYLFSSRKSELPGPLKARDGFSLWQGHLYHPSTTDDLCSFRFLGKTLNVGEDWNFSDVEKLWLYNLHYNDDLNAVDSGARPSLCNELIERWIKHNPVDVGNGWEPYCLSLRIVNWIKWFSRGENEATDRQRASLASQAASLEGQIEYHILANHLFANGKALLFAGAFFDDERSDVWLKKGIKIVKAELSEQFLSDGGHFELSPMYHSILIWDICDLIELARVSGLSEIEALLPELKDVLQRGLVWLDSMCHPDGDISFFNDSAFGIAPLPEQVRSYAASLGISTLNTDHHSAPLRHYCLKETGYIAVDMAGAHKAIIDTANVGASYQPGHAHADSLSFELSLFGQRVFVNSGISEYGTGPLRAFQRSTRAHNTVELDGLDSSQVWSGFRVGKRARVKLKNIITDQRSVRISASHNGYASLFNKLIHHRDFEISDGTFEIIDRVSGRYDSAVFYLYLHPAVSVKACQAGEWQISIDEMPPVYIRFDGGHCTVEKAKWFPEFGKSVDTQCFRVVLSEDTLQSSISWKG